SYSIPRTVSRIYELSMIPKVKLPQKVT
ncbi:MAG: hypothetical protein EZS28_047006, partial [Streblomastix strix]